VPDASVERTRVPVTWPTSSKMRSPKAIFFLPVIWKSEEGSLIAHCQSSIETTRFSSTPRPPSVASSHTQLSSSILLVLSCGPEWGGAE